MWSINTKIALFKTEGFYYFPSGWSPQLKGIEPDIAVNFNNFDEQREADLFYSPLRASDIILNTTQTQLNYNESACFNLNFENEDLQISQAGNFILCRQSGRL